MSTDSPTSLFAQERPLYRAYCDRLESLLSDLLDENGIDYVQLDGRVKSESSFSEKIRRKRYNNPFAQMTDIVGLRIVTYYKEDVDAVEAMLRREFSVDETNSVDKATELDPDRFGYLSRHFVASLDSTRSGLGEWSRYREFKAEFQVRTALQHAWAAVQHKLEYKNAGEAPLELRRSLSRLSALFEIADDQFSSVRAQTQAVERDYREQVNDGVEHLPLDAKSVRALFQDSPLLEQLQDIAASSDVTIENNAQWEQEDIRHLLDFCEVLEINDADALVSALRLVDPTTRRLCQEFYRAFVRESGNSHTTYATIFDVPCTILNVRYPNVDSIADTFYSATTMRTIAAVRAEMPGLLE